MPPSPYQSATDVLVLAAHVVEVAPFADALDAFPPREVHCMTAVVGVGMPVAGAGATRALLELRPRAVVLVGSAGVYPGRFAFAPGEIVVAKSVALVDAAVAGGRASHPDAMATHAATDPVLAVALGGDLRRVRVAATPGITLDDALARELGARSGCDVENLETLSVALACAGVGVPFAALLAITNAVGADGRTQWRAHHAAGAEATCRAVARWLHAGAPGLAR
jgi:nucleoside phosphorylase